MIYSAHELLGRLLRIATYSIRAEDQLVVHPGMADRLTPTGRGLCMTSSQISDGDALATAIACSTIWIRDAALNGFWRTQGSARRAAGSA